MDIIQMKRLFNDAVERPGQVCMEYQFVKTHFKLFLNLILANHEN